MPSREEMTELDALEDFMAGARSWLDVNAERRPVDGRIVWGQGSDSVALFQNLSYEEEKEHIEACRRWISRKADAGFANLSWDRRWGGRGLPPAYDRAFRELEGEYQVPTSHEAVGITTDLIAPTIHAVGTDDQRERFLRKMLRTDELWCQLFSEPAAGSDLAGVTTRGDRDGADWVLNGQKVWTSGAQFADWGYVLCRTDPTVAKHSGLTAFVVSMSAPGVEVRPLRQMTGGASFNEVFFTDVRVPDRDRLGDPGGGWRVALTTLGFERGSFLGATGNRTVARLIELARQLELSSDPLVRDKLARAYSRERILQWTGERVKARLRSGEPPGPEGSIGKLYWTESLRVYNDVAMTLLGSRLAANTGEWGMYAWTEHLLGSAGYRVAAGTDEVQRNILAERVLGLPSGHRADRDVPFRDIPTSSR